MSDKIFHKLHYSSLPFKNDKDKHINYSSEMYDSMFRMMTTLKNSENTNIIFNRSHLGESVYSPLYRGYSGDFIFNIEKKYTKLLRENLYLITLINDPHVIWSRNDGESFHKNEEGIRAEADGFKRAHRLSSIKNKILINVGTMNPNDLNKIIIEFLSEVNSITGEPIQSKLFTDE